MDNQHTFQCSDCGYKWQGGIESPNRFGTYAHCPECLSVQGSYHVCCQEKQGKKLCEDCKDIPVIDPDIDTWCETCFDKKIKELNKPMLRPNKAVGTYVRSGGRV